MVSAVGRSLTGWNARPARPNEVLEPKRRQRLSRDELQAGGPAALPHLGIHPFVGRRPRARRRRDEVGVPRRPAAGARATLASRRRFTARRLRGAGDLVIAVDDDCGVEAARQFRIGGGAKQVRTFDRFSRWYRRRMASIICGWTSSA